MIVNMAVPYNPETSGPRSKQAVIFYAPEKTDFLFEHGDHVNIWLQAINRSLRIDWAMSRNRVETPILTGSCDPAFDESFKISIPTAHLLPGFYDIKVKIHFTDKLSLDAITVFGWQAKKEPLVPVMPENFKAYWQAEKEKLDKVPLDLKITLDRTLKGDEIGAYNLAHAALPEHYDPAGEKFQEVEVYKVDFAAPNGMRIYGWYAKPAGKGPFPAILVLPGAGNNPRPAPVEHARHGFAVLDINVHNAPVDLPKEQYPNLQAQYDRPFTTPENYWGYDVYRNALQGVNALAQLPGVDPNRLSVLGGSQGGRASTVVAGVDPRIKAAILGIAHFSYMPWLRWTERLNKAHDAGNRVFTSAEVVKDDQLRVESYFDIMNFATLIRCPVLLNSGLSDGVSPPTGVFAIYRNIQSPKEIIPLPNIAHDWSPAFDRYAWKWLHKQLSPDGVTPAARSKGTAE